MSCNSCVPDNSITFNVKQGTDYSAGISISGIDLTGASAIMQIRATKASPTVIATIGTATSDITINVVAGTPVVSNLTVMITKANNDLLAANGSNSFVADIAITQANGLTINPLDINISYDRSVTR